MAHQLEVISTNESFYPDDFRPLPSSVKSQQATMQLDELKKIQLDEFNDSQKDWIPFIGNDLYVFMKYQWSSLTSLQACAKDVESNLSVDNTSEHLALKELASKFEEDLVSWANDWAGMFVFALREMKMRALCVAKYLAKTKSEAMMHPSMHPSDVCEDLGTALYGDLIGSRTYGYPMKFMSPHEKREIAECAKIFFEEAVELSSRLNFKSKCEIVSWENHFMIGKCHEKIASTLQDEVFISGGHPSPRQYEKELNLAIEIYSIALVDAKKCEQTTGGKHESGGSSHGHSEVFYRIHTCRLKTLIRAIRRPRIGRKLAEMEAIRITSLIWFGDAIDLETLPTVRHRMWALFVNCVHALLQCIKDEPKFHRAVYRIAQAFNWAPFFYDSDRYVVGSGCKTDVLTIGNIALPCIEAGSCDKNAALAMETLFDKRRSQICAVWVTTSSTPSPFEVLNDSVRKYDYLRLKYTKAYIDCMKHCKKMDKIEALLSSATSSAQDLAGFYKASAGIKGGDPGKHTKQSLLKASGFIADIKWSANDALAELILTDLKYLRQNGVNNDQRTLLDAGFKLSNKLFLRLNSPPREVVQHMVSAGPILQVIALCKCFISIQAGYRVNDSIKFEELDNDTLLSFVEQALDRAKEMFSKNNIAK